MPCVSFLSSCTVQIKIGLLRIYNCLFFTFGLKNEGLSLRCCGRAFVCQYVGYLSQEWISHKWGLMDTHKFSAKFVSLK